MKMGILNRYHIRKNLETVSVVTFPWTRNRSSASFPESKETCYNTPDSDLRMRSCTVRVTRIEDGKQMTQIDTLS